MTVIADTGVLLAAADADDADRERCAQLLRKHRGMLRVPAPAVPECSWQVEHNLGAASEARFLRLITTGEITVIDLIVAENLGVKTVATLNRRNFTVVRPRHVDALELIP